MYFEASEVYTQRMRRILHVVTDPLICHGKPVIAGTRVMVWQILELLEAGEGKSMVYQAYPSLPDGSVEAALHFAAERAKSQPAMDFHETSQPQIFA